MLRSMYSGVSGLRGHQTMMDIVGNNIANVNTAGYKASQVVFQDLLSQTLQGAGVPDDAGGTNPSQVGLGVRVAGTVASFTQGGLQNTGRATDLSIQGDGFFSVRTGSETLYTRAGAFSFDAGGRLVTPQGAVVQGWTADTNGVVNTNAATSDIVMPIGQLISPQATSTIDLGGNLPADAPEDTEIVSSITVYDDQGTASSVAFTFVKTSTANQWAVTARADTDGDGEIESTETVGTQTLTFDPATGDMTALAADWQLSGLAGEWTDEPTIDFGAPGERDRITQFSALNTLSALAQDGSAVGSLQSFSISPDGVVSGVFSNGRNQPLGQIALASFNNPAGLEKAGSSMYRTTVNSGLAQVGLAGAGGRGSLAGGTLEMSNVDLAQEFTNLIVAQRGFQANSRVITSSDELLQDLVNMKR